jgi:hypothetical protein
MENQIIDDIQIKPELMELPMHLYMGTMANLECL